MVENLHTLICCGRFLIGILKHSINLCYKIINFKSKIEYFIENYNL